MKILGFELEKSLEFFQFNEKISLEQPGIEPEFSGRKPGVLPLNYHPFLAAVNGSRYECKALIFFLNFFLRFDFLKRSFKLFLIIFCKDFKVDILSISELKIIQIAQI